VLEARVGDLADAYERAIPKLMGGTGERP
jgi:hypothetical protein